MKDYIVTEFTKTFEGVNLNLMNDDEKGYDYSRILIYINECDRGFKVKRVNKTTKKGTSVVYEPIASKDDFEKYKQVINAEIDEFNKKWNENIQLN